MANNIRIFIIKDTFFLQEILCRVFSEVGMEVVGLASLGEEALPQIKDLKPDLIWLNLVLPGVQNGITLINKINQLHSEIKIIACSSLQQKQIQKQSELAGAVCFANKPFKSDEIVEVVFSAVRQKEQKEMVA